MTTIIRRRPSTQDLSHWVDRIFEDRFLPQRLFPDLPFEDAESLRVEELVEDDAYVVRAELPGVDPDKDLEVSVHDGMLSIRAERHESAERKDTSGYRSEFHYGLLRRTVALPAGATSQDVKATFKDGVLEVRLPTGAHDQATTIPVERVS